MIFPIRFQVNCKKFHLTLIAQDETWIHHLEPESKIQENSGNTLHFKKHNHDRLPEKSENTIGQ